MAFNRDRNSNSRGGDRGGFRPRPSFGDRPRFNDRSDRGPAEMHSAICDNCGKECQVPFRPTQGKPVYCSNCFEQQRGSEPRRDDRPRFSENRSERPAPRDEAPRVDRLEEVNAKLDAILELLKGKETTKPTKKAKKEAPVEEAIEETAEEIAEVEESPVVEA